MKSVAGWAAPPIIVMVFAWLALGGVHRNIHVPYLFSGDALFYLAQSKSTLDHAWWWENPSIGAPSGYHASAFAQNVNVDQAIVKVIGILAGDLGLSVNIAWLTMLGLSALTATWGLRRLGVSRLGAGAAGVLFALTPFAAYRNLGHFNMVTYLLPIPATIGLLLASSDREHPWRLREWAVPIAGCVLLGFNYVYFAFFGAFVIAIGGLAGAVRIGSRAPLKAAAWCLSALILAATLNMIPSVLAWQAHGSPAGVVHVPAESEIYGLKIRHLVTPAYGHWFAPFRTWLARDEAAGFTGENENASARLGAIATAGFFGLICSLIVPAAAGRTGDRLRVQAAGVLTIAVVLIGMVGGFGSLFSLLVSPEIRAYNRVSPFIAFFALAGVALWVDRLTRARPDRWRSAFWVLLLCVGLADQLAAFRGLATYWPAAEKRFGEVASFTSALESRLPDNAMIYQLPVRPYPADPGVERLGVYEQFEPYLTTRRLRWSYPAMTRDQLIFERAVEGVSEAELPRYLARQGFSAILISRAGYRDGGRQLEQALVAPAAGATLIAANDDYVALDLRHLGPPSLPR